MNDVIDVRLVKKLISDQIPDLKDLPIEPVRKQGWDNRTFRLGDELAVRLPSNASYAAAVPKETIALTALSGQLNVPVPEVVATGEPSEAYPLPWSVRRWIAGTTLEETEVTDRLSLARDLAAILVDLRSAPIKLDLIAGKHSFFRGCHPGVYGDEVVQSVDKLKDQLDARLCLDIWLNGTNSAWAGNPVWFHGDMAVGNILMTGEKVSALIDFGICGVGDPACDYVMAWTFFSADERLHFKEALGVDEDTWQRAKAWALWKALACLSGISSPDTDGVQARALDEIMREGA